MYVQNLAMKDNVPQIQATPTTIRNIQQTTENSNIQTNMFDDVLSMATKNAGIFTVDDHYINSMLPTDDLNSYLCQSMPNPDCYVSDDVIASTSHATHERFEAVDLQQHVVDGSEVKDTVLGNAESLKTAYHKDDDSAEILADSNDGVLNLTTTGENVCETLHAIPPPRKENANQNPKSNRKRKLLESHRLVNDSPQSKRHYDDDVIPTTPIREATPLLTPRSEVNEEDKRWDRNCKKMFKYLRGFQIIFVANYGIFMRSDLMWLNTGI